MDQKESEFLEKLMETFREEAAEHLKALSDGLLELEKKQPPETQQQLIETIFREAHSLKGAARSVNQQNILEICQTLETTLSLWKQNKIHISPSSFDILHATISIINNALTTPIDPTTISKTISELKSLSNDDNDQPHTKIPTTSNFKEDLHTPHTTPQKNSTKTIRVSLDKINQFFQETEETLMIKVLFKAQLSHLKQLQANLSTQEKNLNVLITNFQKLQRSQENLSTQNHIEPTKAIFKSLETQLKEIETTKNEVNTLLKNAEQHAHIVGSTIDTLIEDLKKILMQPMSVLFETLPHTIRDISRELSKEIHVEFQGEDIEVDRRVLEEMKDPIMHLIRNAIDHGIESPEERIKLNKNPSGTIQITATEKEGNHVQLSITDDGHGIDMDKIKQVSLKKGLISQNDLSTLSDAETIKLAFHSDISTSPIVTELSGRGLGLGIVAEKVEKLGGQIQVSSKLHQGTTFTITLPLTLATFRGVYISVSDQEFFLPTHNVEKAIRVNLNDIKKTENRETITIDNRAFSFIHLADLLGIARKAPTDNHNTLLSALIVKAAEQTIVFGADHIHNEQEILVKSLGKQPIRIKNIMAATVVETGRVIPILNPTDLIQSAIKADFKTPSYDMSDGNQAAKQSILLVEDSITTRLLIKNILTTANYDVKTAVDGMEALEILQNQSFDLIISDIEMPRMDGFTLLEKIRTMSQTKETPVIICTALGSSKDRQRGIELGANAYLDKSTLNFQSFVSVVQKVI